MSFGRDTFLRKQRQRNNILRLENRDWRHGDDSKIQNIYAVPEFSSSRYGQGFSGPSGNRIFHSGLPIRRHDAGIRRLDNAGISGSLGNQQYPQGRVRSDDYQDYRASYGGGTGYSADAPCCPLVADPLLVVTLLGSIAAATYFFNELIMANISAKRRRSGGNWIIEKLASSNLLFGKKKSYWSKCSYRI